jgi:hypothetical protein
MNCEIYDDEDGFMLVFDTEQGMTFNFFLSDEQAEDIIGILQNKLNARIK